MEFTEEFIKDNELKPETVTAIKGLYDNNIAELKQQWDGKANENAEGILGGASKFAKELFKVEVEREKGQKWGDYLQNIAKKAFEKRSQTLQEKEQELNEKLKNFKGGDEYKERIESLTLELDKYKQTAAELEPLKGIDEKYKEAVERLEAQTVDIAFGSVRPSFPETVNEYEAKHKWGEFVKSTLENYDIQMVEGEAIAVSKENQYKQEKLSDLLKKDETISELLKGRQQNGTAVQPADLTEVEGVPFKIPKGATSEEISALTRKYLIEQEKMDVMDGNWTKKFTEIYTKAKKAA